MNKNAIDGFIAQHRLCRDVTHNAIGIIEGSVRCSCATLLPINEVRAAYIATLVTP